MSKPQIGNVPGLSSPVRAISQRRKEDGLLELGWHRGEQSGHFEVAELLRKWGFTRIAAQVLKHYGMDSKGSIRL